jgi:hypothetical protein
VPGFDTAGKIQDVYPSAEKEHGIPRFWARYFSPAYNIPIDAGPEAELAACWDSGSRYLIPICEPQQSHLSGTASQGTADAKAFCSAVYNTYITVHPLQLPSNHKLYCYLGQEASTSLSQAYWNAWAGYLLTYEFGTSGIHPLYPALYCNPIAAPPNCSVVNAHGSHTCAAIWTSEPEGPAYCSKAVSDPPAWNADGCFEGKPMVMLWQYAEQGVCNFSSDVDLDLGTPHSNPTDFSFWLSSRP